MKQIILASGSPRRAQLLKKIGLKFKVDASNFDEESIAFKTPIEMVTKLSLEKAKVVLKRHPNAIIIAADTTVFIDGKIIGKPKSAQDAKRILKLLSGKTHKVITGLTVMDKSSSITNHAVTAVTFKDLAEKEIEAYIRAENLMDKAGAYAIQDRGALFIEKISGDYSSVIGVPLVKLSQSLDEFGVNIALQW